MDDETYRSAPHTADVVAVTYSRRSDLLLDGPTAEAFQRAMVGLQAALQLTRPVRHADSETSPTAATTAEATDAIDMDVSPPPSPRAAQCQQDHPARDASPSVDTTAELSSPDLDEARPEPGLAGEPLTRTTPLSTRPPSTGQRSPGAPGRTPVPPNEGAQTFGKAAAPAEAPARVDELDALASLDLNEEMLVPRPTSEPLTPTSPGPIRPPMIGRKSPVAPGRAPDTQGGVVQAFGDFRAARAEWTQAANALGVKEHRTIAEMFDILASKLQNDGTTRLRHEEHPFRFINLFVALSGGATDALCRAASWGPVPSSLEELQKIFPGTTDARVVTRDDSRSLKLKFTDLQQLREARLVAWRRGWLPKYPRAEAAGKSCSGRDSITCPSRT